MEGHPVRIETQNISDSGGGGGYRLFAGEEMSEPKVTKENMLFHLKHGCSFYPVCPICNAIRVLIEHGPEVSRGFVVNSARAMHVEPDALRICLEEAGVTVKEGKEHA